MMRPPIRCVKIKKEGVANDCRNAEYVPQPRLETHLLLATNPPKEVHDRSPSRQRSLWSRQQHQAPKKLKLLTKKNTKKKEAAPQSCCCSNDETWQSSDCFHALRSLSFQQTPEYNMDSHPNLGERLNGSLLAVLLSQDKKVLPPTTGSWWLTAKGHWE